MSVEVLNVVLPILGLVVAVGGLWVAGKQLGTGRVQTLLNEQGLRLSELQGLHMTRLSTLNATIEDLQQQIGSLEVICRLNQQHAERCEAELARLRQSGGFRYEGGV